MSIQELKEWKEIEQESKPYNVHMVDDLIEEITFNVSDNAGKRKICKCCMFCVHGSSCHLTFDQRMGMKACYKAFNIYLLRRHNLYEQKKSIQTSAN